MATKFQSALRVTALLAGVAVATACSTVTPEQLDAVRATAEAAQNAANNAQRAANDARAAANSAQATANQALSAAQAAQACCDANTQRIDRMFDELQQK